MTGEVPFSEAGRGVADGFQNFGDGDLFGVHERMHVHAVVLLCHAKRITAGHQRGARSGAHRHLVEVRQANRFPRHLIHVRRPHVRVALIADVVSLIVRHDDYHVGL